MTAAAKQKFEVGQRVSVTQQIPMLNQVWTTQVMGTVVGFEQRKTGSWFAHSKDDKLWLDRLVVKKDNGETAMCILDQYTRIEVLPEPEPEPEEAKEAEEDGDGEAGDEDDEAQGTDQAKDDVTEEKA